MKTSPISRWLVCTTAAVSLWLASCAAPLPPTSVSLVEPANGATVSSPFKVRFAVLGMDVVSAGNMAPRTGHHHLLINQAPVAAGQVVPTTPQHLHFDAGQTETLVTLPPGTYQLTAQFANGAHQSYGPNWSQTITVTVR